MSKTDEKVSTEQEKPSLIGGVMCSILIQDGNYSVGDKYGNNEILEVHKLELSFNRNGVIWWYLYDSISNHINYYINYEIKSIENYFYECTCYYPETKFIEWPKYQYKGKTYKIAEDLGFESPRKMADYLLKNYKEAGFSGQIVSFKNVSY